MGIKLVTDSTCDLSLERLEKRGIGVLPLKVLFGDKEYVDKFGISTKAFYDKMRESDHLPTTSQVNPGEFYDYFEKELSKGNQVIGIFLSGQLSGTYRSATIAKNMLESEDIFLLDSQTASFSLALIILKIQDMIDSGQSVEAILEEANQLIGRAQLYGMLDTLENLKKGGRLSSGAAMIGKMLNLKPIIEVVEGSVNVAHKARGSAKGTKWMLDQLEKDCGRGPIDQVAVAFGGDESKADQLKDLLNDRFEIKEIIKVELGSVVGTHTGEGVVGIAYFK